MPIIKSETVIKLPAPAYDGKVSVEHALFTRRSVRFFNPDALSLKEVSQLLWSAQGISSPKGFRTAPSAGALYPLEVYTIIGNVRDVAPGIYKYDIRAHALLITVAGDRRKDISRAALNQRSIAQAPVALLFSTVPPRVTTQYGERGLNYVFMEVGHAAQNVCLQAVALRLGAVVIGAFRDKDIRTITNLPESELPVYLIPVGRCNRKEEEVF